MSAGALAVLDCTTIPEATFVCICRVLGSETQAFGMSRMLQFCDRIQSSTVASSGGGRS